MAKQRKGALLFSLRVPFTWKRTLVAVLAALTITDKLYSFLTTTRPERGFKLAFSLAMVAVWSAVLFAIIFRRTLRLYEEGVAFPASSWGDMRFLRWEQIERYDWHGGVLGMVAVNQPLAGKPVRGGEVRIPVDMWPEVEAILKQKKTETTLSGRVWIIGFGCVASPVDAVLVLCRHGHPPSRAHLGRS